MTPKARRDAQIELRDYALELERAPDEKAWNMPMLRGQRLDRARLLRAVAAELDRVPEEQ